MTLTIMFLLYLILLIYPLILHRGVIAPIYLTVFGVLNPFLGIYLLNTTTNYYLIYYFGIIVLLFGYTLFFLIKGKKENKDILLLKKNVNRLVYIVIFFVVYHFAIGGIPIISNNLEVERFNFSSSGLFGIPSRMFLYGLPFVTVYTVINYSVESTKENKKLMYIAIASYILSRILNGFKSGLIEVFDFYIIVAYLMFKPISLAKLFFKLRYWMMYIFMGGFSVLMLLSYDNFKDKLSNIRDIFNYFLNRIFIESAMPKYQLISGNITHIFGKQNYFFSDLLYYINRYFKLPVISDNYFPLENLVSVTIYNTPLSKQSFIVPVTMGGLSEIYYLFKMWSFIIIFILGILFAFLCYKARYCENLFNKTVFIMFVFYFNMYLIKGNIWYYVINFISTILFLKIIDIFVNVKIKY